MDRRPQASLLGGCKTHDFGGNIQELFSPVRDPADPALASVNNITAIPDHDGAITVRFGGRADGRPNCLPIMDGWNFMIRLYRPRAEIVNGTWTFPTITPAP
jgi:hypothetical protein